MTPRILCVTDALPWPSDDGYRLRMANLVAGLAEAGDVDLISADQRGGTAADVPDALEVTSTVVRWAPPRSAAAWVPRWTAGAVRGTVPRRMLKGQLDPLRSAVSDALASTTYDLVWFEHVDVWAATADLVEHHQPTAARVCDFDNLENLLLRGRRRIPPAWPSSRGASAVVRRVATAGRWVISRLFDLDDERRFDRLQRHIASRVDRVVVCSPVDVERSGCPNAVCVPNGFEPTDGLAARLDGPRTPPTFVFVGLMSYQPNRDAAHWFARDVFPLVRDGTGAELRLVGRRPEALDGLERLDGVTVVGEVDSTTPELDRADIAVIPIRFGGGTRLKAVEAMAHGRPIAATSIGIEGLGLRDGFDVEVGDDAASLAAACRRLLDPQHHRTVAANAEATYRDRYEWSTIRSQVASMVGELVDPTRSR